MATSVSELVSEAKGRIENLGPDQVAAEQEKGALLVDIREPAELQKSGQIAGAIHAPRGMLEFHADPKTPYYMPEFESDRRIVLYCASGGRSALAADALQRMGYTNVAHLDGGLKAWSEQQPEAR